ncbi:MAG: hypothetical protein AAGI70_00595, partial [Pseudomonadota bacterium]
MATTRTRWWAWLVAGAVMLGLIAGIGASVDLLKARAAAEPELAGRAPLTVTATPLMLVDEYQVRESFAGRIEPARETMLSAERGGLLVELMVEEGDRVAAGQVVAKLDMRSL